MANEKKAAAEAPPLHHWILLEGVTRCQLCGHTPANAPERCQSKGASAQQEIVRLRSEVERLTADNERLAKEKAALDHRIALQTRGS